MRVAFVHDHRFLVKNGVVSTEAQFSSSAWNRYLQVFEEVVVVARRACKEYENRVQRYSLSEAPNVRFEFAPSLSSIAGQTYGRQFVARRLRRILGQCDALICRLPSQLGILAVEVANAIGKPWAVEIAGCPRDGLRYHGHLAARLYAPVYARRMRRVVSRAPFALYVTSEFLQRRYPCPNGREIACSNVEIPPPREWVLERRLERIESSAGQTTFGTIGSLKNRTKGLGTIIVALSLLRKSGVECQVRVLGEGNSDPWIRIAEEYEVEDLIHFDGTLPSGEAVYEWLDSVDVYLQPSFKEGLPRALIEAMSRGCPAIGSACAGIPELLPPEVLITPGDAGHLASLCTQSLSIEWQRLHATRNWTVSSDYGSDILEERRRAFWSEFAAYVRRNRS